MFKRFIEKMAGKASLINIKFDLDNLQQFFPHSPAAASKHLFGLIENITLARANGMSDTDISAAIQNKFASLQPELQQIITAVHSLFSASTAGDTTLVAQLDAVINRIFRETTGAPLDTRQISLLARIAMSKTMRCSQR